MFIESQVNLSMVVIQLYCLLFLVGGESAPKEKASPQD